MRTMASCCGSKCSSRPKTDVAMLYALIRLDRPDEAIALTLSDGYCLFSDPNPLPTPDHLHNWYAFWERGLGRPVHDG